MRAIPSRVKMPFAESKRPRLKCCLDVLVRNPLHGGHGRAHVVLAVLARGQDRGLRSQVLVRDRRQEVRDTVETKQIKQTKKKTKKDTK